MPYLWKKIGQIISKVWGEDTAAMNQYYKISRIMEKILTILDFINLALFIRYGKYRCLIQRILKLKMKFVQS